MDFEDRFFNLLETRFGEIRKDIKDLRGEFAGCVKEVDTKCDGNTSRLDKLDGRSAGISLVISLIIGIGSFLLTIFRTR